MRTRAQRRAAKNRLARKWLRRIKIRWGKRLFAPLNPSSLTEQELHLMAVGRTETHRDLRNHPRKTCSYCNPLFKRLKKEKILDRDFNRELELLDVNLHDLLSPTPD